MWRSLCTTNKCSIKIKLIWSWHHQKTSPQCTTQHLRLYLPPSHEEATSHPDRLANATLHKRNTRTNGACHPTWVCGTGPSWLQSGDARPRFAVTAPWLTGHYLSIDDNTSFHWATLNLALRTTFPRNSMLPQVPESGLRESVSHDY